MASDTQWNSLLQGVENWNQWRKQNTIDKIDLSDADLKQISLRKANLSQANLIQADLSESNLSQANVYNADLRNANLAKANAYKIDLSSANLHQSSLRCAHLNKANLYDACLNAADLRGVELCNANVIGAQLVGANLTGADLTGANLAGANLTDANLTGANLTDANLTGAVVIGTNLTATIWAGANLSGAQLKNNLGVTEVNQSAMQALGAHFQDALVEPLKETYHLLLIEDKRGRRIFRLESETYSLGRDQDASIQLYDQSVSRFHALLLPMRDRNQVEFYRLVDGDREGNPSKNGLKVNKVACRVRNLESGDKLKVGRTRIEYRIANLTATEFEQYLKIGKADPMLTKIPS